MKRHAAMAITLAVLIVATFGTAQSRLHSVKIPFEFKAAGTIFPAGEYEFSYESGKRVVLVRGIANTSSAFVPIITMLSGAIHTTPSDAHVVFDKIGNDHLLAEIWIPGMDGIDLLSTKEKHEHEVVNVPLK
jgi:hypothetical protein